MKEQELQTYFIILADQNRMSSLLTIRYFLLTFTHNIRDFKVKKIGGKDAKLWF